MRSLTAGCRSGTRLTPSRVLAAELEVSRSTVTDAYERLAPEGYVEGRRGGGTVVAGGILPPPRDHEASHSNVVPTLDAATIGRYGPSPVARCRRVQRRVRMTWTDIIRRPRRRKACSHAKAPASPARPNPP